MVSPGSRFLQAAVNTRLVGRQYVGNIRLDTPEQGNTLNILDEKIWLSYKFFQAVMHVAENVCQADKVVRHWDQAQTPSQRLVGTSLLSGGRQARLQALDEQTNPMALRREIYRLLAAL
jgi:hypothetical protein